MLEQKNVINFKKKMKTIKLTMSKRKVGVKTENNC